MCFISNLYYNYKSLSNIKSKKYPTVRQVLREQLLKTSYKILHACEQKWQMAMTPPNYLILLKAQKTMFKGHIWRYRIPSPIVWLRVHFWGHWDETLDFSKWLLRHFVTIRFWQGHTWAKQSLGLTFIICWKCGG